jgi:hypothetical protein
VSSLQLRPASRNEVIRLDRGTSWMSTRRDEASASRAFGTEGTSIRNEKPPNEALTRWAVVVIWPPVLALIALWLASVLTLVVVAGIWAPIALRLWGPLALGFGWGGVQASLAALVYWRVQRVPRLMRSWWSVGVAVIAILLTPSNVIAILLTLGSIFGRGIG